MNYRAEDDRYAPVKVARDLREIARLALYLPARAIGRAADKEMPGGDALVMLGPVGNHEAAEWMRDHHERQWQAAYEMGDATREDYPDHDWEDDDWQPALQTLLFWSQGWREEHGKETDWPTILTEAKFLHDNLDFAWHAEAHWDDFAADIRDARLRLENVLRDGRRAHRSQVKCDREACERKPRLIRVHRVDPDDITSDAKDEWKCPCCKHVFDDGEYARVQNRQMNAEGMERWVELRVALQGMDRPQRTVRDWLANGKAHWWCDVVTHRVYVWWPDLRHLDLTMPRRNRHSAA